MPDDRMVDYDAASGFDLAAGGARRGSVRRSSLGLGEGFSLGGGVGARRGSMRRKSVTQLWPLADQLGMWSSDSSGFSLLLEESLERYGLDDDLPPDPLATRAASARRGSVRAPSVAGVQERMNEAAAHV